MPATSPNDPTTSPEPSTQISIEQKIEHNQGNATAVTIENLTGTVFIDQQSPEYAALRRSLGVLIQKVRDFWIKGVLERSVQGAALIPLGKRTCPDAVTLPLAADLPSDSIAAPAEEAPGELSDLFAQSHNALLVMDGAGSGKTTALLALARQLLQQSEPTRGALLPVPVVLNLANWPGEHLSISDWVIQELSIKYQIPRETGREWLKNNLLALMLDGLDEVPPKRLVACIRAINQFREECATPIAIATRTEDYRSANDRLRLDLAIQLEPLTDEQVEAYLEAGQPGTLPLREVLRNDEELRELAHSPQMLNMMRLAYSGVSVEMIQGEALDSREERRAHLLEIYANRMLEQYGQQPKGPSRVDTALFRRWLGSLARGIEKSGQAIFMIELLQPGWLNSEGLRWVYWLVSRSMTALLLGLVVAVTARAASTPEGRAAYVGASLLAGLLIGVLDRWWMSPAAIPVTRPRLAGWGYFLATCLLGGLSYGLLFGLLLHRPETLQLCGLAAVGCGILFGLTGKERQRGEDIRPAMNLTWSWAQFRRGILPGALISAAVLVGILMLPWSQGPESYVPYGIVLAAITLLLILLVYGLRGLQIDTRGFPNQGTWISARNAALMGLLLGGGSGLIYAMRYSPWNALLIGLRVGILAVLWYGGYETIKHIVLRVLLTVGGTLPLNLVKMLDQAVHLRFLHRAGGGYFFANRLLRDYFRQF